MGGKSGGVWPVKRLNTHDKPPQQPLEDPTGMIGLPASPKLGYDIFKVESHSIFKKYYS